MADALFVRDGDAVVPTELTLSPWSARSLHGGPVAAALAHALEAVPTRNPCSRRATRWSCCVPWGSGRIGRSIRSLLIEPV